MLNRRRFLLTVAMLAIGVASLVGIETAVDVLAREVVGSFDKLGAATLLLRPKADAPPIDARQAVAKIVYVWLEAGRTCPILCICGREGEVFGART